MSTPNLRWIALLIVDKSPLQTGECIYRLSSLPPSPTTYLLTPPASSLIRRTRPTTAPKSGINIFKAPLFAQHDRPTDPLNGGGEGTLSLL